MSQTQNNVELVGYYGDDTLVCCAAWTSIQRDLANEKQDVERQQKLLSALAKDGHHTPWERPYLHFQVSCETASHIHILKHRIGISVNGESARYRELKADKYHIPGDWSKEEQDLLKSHALRSFEAYHSCLARLVASGMDRKRAKESARFYLPYANSLVLDLSMNLRAFFHLQKLRNDSHAQLEIREIAQQMLELVRGTGAFNLSLEAFGYGK